MMVSSYTNSDFTQIGVWVGWQKGVREQGVKEKGDEIVLSRKGMR